MTRMLVLALIALVPVLSHAAAGPENFDCPVPTSFGLKPDPVDNSGFSASGPGLGDRIGGSYFPFDSATLSGDKKTMFCMYKVGNGRVAFYSKAIPAGKTCTPGAKGFSCK